MGLALIIVRIGILGSPREKKVWNFWNSFTPWLALVERTPNPPSNSSLSKYVAGNSTSRFVGRYRRRTPGPPPRPRAGAFEIGRDWVAQRWYGVFDAVNDEKGATWRRTALYDAPVACQRGAQQATRAAGRRRGEPAGEGQHN